MRADAMRSRARILEAARGCDPTALRLNDVARRAGVGVGTVYRHFPTTHALVEALSAGGLDRYRELAREAAEESDPMRALELLVRRGVALQLEDGGLHVVLLAASDSDPETASLKHEFAMLTERILDAARSAGLVRADLTADRLIHLVCGIEYAVRTDGGDPAFFVDVLLDGLRTGDGTPVGRKSQELSGTR
ncbi:TetR/AcrR family transcriptional regulator [Microbacterium sp. ARD32]|uniref:TetR/AcrR family transcriptional regulator n=1 Tax=Microbacterium sp. ARD32 TaxID=2962577 RepID=UPI002881597B|nr:TetR/AcrR family transcriptional regulator [Microbacterium sp. ARD32]MDT0157611.1 TetR/AcrR family transcriptional regulator [Microbacterium sp. ARD32]